MSDRYYPNYCDGQKISGESHFSVINPATEQLVGYAPTSTDTEIEQAIASAKTAQIDWAARPDQERKDLLMAVAEKLQGESAALAKLITEEQGKPLCPLGSPFEMQAAIGWTQVPASLDIAPEIVFEDETRKDVLHYQALGVVAAIAPWNWPLMIAIWQIIPALRMGNAVVIKPSEYTPLATLELVRLLNEILPAGLVNSVTGAGDVGQKLISHPDIDKVMFTGSESTGVKIMQHCAPNVTRVTLELGGNDPAIILPDANPEAIAEGLFWGSFLNMGQTCACIKRLYVPESLMDEACDALVKLANQMPMGNGLDEGIMLGPIQNKMQYDKVMSLIADAKQAGGTVLCGGESPSGPGYFVPVTLIRDLPDTARLVTEEQFGTALPILSYPDDDLEQAIHRANNSPAGLGASVWGTDPDQTESVAARLNAGTVWINQHGAIHPMVPFGGAKGSGFGLEFGVEGLKAVSQPKIISRNKA